MPLDSEIFSDEFRDELFSKLSNSEKQAFEDYQTFTQKSQILGLSQTSDNKTPEEKTARQERLSIVVAKIDQFILDSLLPAALRKEDLVFFIFQFRERLGQDKDFIGPIGVLHLVISRLESLNKIVISYQTQNPPQEQLKTELLALLERTRVILLRSVLSLMSPDQDDDDSFF